MSKFGKKLMMKRHDCAISIEETTSHLYSIDEFLNRFMFMRPWFFEVLKRLQPGLNNQSLKNNLYKL